ncbi:MAG: efflux RND transporter periplasmic adaptor subunit, partial [Burkholderiaceae bacterium]
MTPSPSSGKVQQYLLQVQKGVVDLANRLLVITEPLIRRVRRTYRQEKAHLAMILAPHKAKWSDPLWNNLKPLLLPLATGLWLRFRDWLWYPILSVLERIAPHQVNRWRALPPSRRHNILFWCITAFIALTILMPDGHKSHNEVTIHDPDIIDLSQDLIEPDSPHWVVDVKPVEVMPFSETLRVSGKVEFDEQRVARIGATVTGRVTEILAMPGQEIDRGTVLARINSTELGQTQLAYLKARAANELAARAYDRAKIL